MGFSRLLIIGIVLWAVLGTLITRTPVFAYYIGAHLMTSGLLWFGIRRLERLYGEG